MRSVKKHNERNKRACKKFNEEIHRRKQNKNQNKNKSSSGAKAIRSSAKFEFIGIWSGDIEKIVINRTSFRGMKNEVFLSVMSFKSTTGTKKQSQIQILSTRDLDLTFRQRSRSRVERERSFVLF